MVPKDYGWTAREGTVPIAKDAIGLIQNILLKRLIFHCKED
jgi:hypothetical protein